MQANTQAPRKTLLSFFNESAHELAARTQLADAGAFQAWVKQNSDSIVNTGIARARREAGNKFLNGKSIHFSEREANRLATLLTPPFPCQ